MPGKKLNISLFPKGESILFLQDYSIGVFVCECECGLLDVRRHNILSQNIKKISCFVSHFLSLHFM